MRRSLPFLAGIAALGLAVPAAAQNGDLTLAVFITVETSEMQDFEEALIEHSEWHGDQNGTWAWPVYQALTGGQVEYVVLTAGHEWADFDTPDVDILADQAHWAGSGARHTVSEDVIFWLDNPELSNGPADPSAFPILQVFEFEMKPGGERAVQHGMEKFKEAVDMAGGGGAPFTWSTVVSADGPAGFFVAAWAPNFAAFGAGGPTPEEILIGAFGEVEGRQIADDFAAAATQTSSQIWMYRPDLSYIPS